MTGFFFLGGGSPNNAVLLIRGRWKMGYQCQKPRIHHDQTETNNQIRSGVLLNCSAFNLYESAPGSPLNGEQSAPEHASGLQGIEDGRDGPRTQAEVYHMQGRPTCEVWASSFPLAAVGGRLPPSNGPEATDWGRNEP